MILNVEALDAAHSNKINSDTLDIPNKAIRITKGNAGAVGYSEESPLAIPDLPSVRDPGLI